MSLVIAFTVHGLPKPQGSKVVRRHGTRQWAQEASKALPEWRQAVRREAGDAMEGPEVDEPVLLDVRFYMPRPRGHFGTGRNAGRLKGSAPLLPTTTPDLDKLIRAVCDAMTGIVWRSDSDVTTIRAAKRYADDRRIGVDVRVETEAAVAMVEAADWARAL
jgi:Holliday junction resolvase RusA-like endonuclease